MSRFKNFLLGRNHAMNDVGDQLGAPRIWVVCPHCGAQDWRVPPHGIGEPCPLVKSLSDSFGLKFDAERMATLRSGHQMEQVSRLFEQQFLQPEEEEENDE
jgi:hypothetical protein